MSVPSRLSPPPLAMAAALWWQRRPTVSDTQPHECYRGCGCRRLRRHCWLYEHQGHSQLILRPPRGSGLVCCVVQRTCRVMGVVHSVEVHRVRPSHAACWEGVSTALRSRSCAHTHTQPSSGDGDPVPPACCETTYTPAPDPQTRISSPESQQKRNGDSFAPIGRRRKRYMEVPNRPTAARCPLPGLAVP